MTKYLTVIITCGVLLLTISCKKESKNTASSNPGGGSGSAASLSLTAYPNVTGHKWVYKYSFYQQIDYNNSTTTNTATLIYTVTVLGDTTLPNNSKGKIWQISHPDSSTNSKQVAYLDTINNVFNVYSIPDIGTQFVIFTLSYPLTSTPKWWINYGLPAQDTSKVTGQSYFNGKQAIEITRGDLMYNGQYHYKIGNKGCLNQLYEHFEVVNNQFTYIREENNLLSTNF
jgi:hypothetical protein